MQPRKRRKKEVDLASTILNNLQILNAGLVWLLTAACIKTGRPEIAKRAIEVVEQRLSKDGWQEYYDGKEGLYLGKQSKKLQIRSIAGYLVSKMLLEEPSRLEIISLDEDMKLKPITITRSTTLPTKLRAYAQFVQNFLLILIMSVVLLERKTNYNII